MKEEMLQNDTEDIRQENKKASVSGNGADNEVIDLTEDEWSDADTDGDNPGMTSGISESVLPLLKTVLPIACTALLILLLIITGLSGAGKSQALDALEDRGYYGIDNMPPALIENFIDLSATATHEVNRFALVMDMRGGEFFGGIDDADTSARWSFDFSFAVDAFRRYA